GDLDVVEQEQSPQSQRPDDSRDVDQPIAGRAPNPGTPRFGRLLLVQQQVRRLQRAPRRSEAPVVLTHGPSVGAARTLRQRRKMRLRATKVGCPSIPKLCQRRTTTVERSAADRPQADAWSGDAAAGSTT